MLHVVLLQKVERMFGLGHFQFDFDEEKRRTSSPKHTRELEKMKSREMREKKRKRKEGKNGNCMIKCIFGHTGSIPNMDQKRLRMNDDGN